MILCTLVASSAQLLLKSGVGKINFSSLLSAIITAMNTSLVVGFFLYGVGAVLMLLAFKRGELSILYPIMASSYIWVSISSPIFFPSDSMNPLKWVGIMIILLSVSMLGYASSKKARGEND